MARTLEQQRAASRKFRKNNPDYYKIWREKNPYWARYGLSLKDYERMLDDQGGVCAGCFSPPGKNRLAIDHDHETGHVRWLLCNHCNSVLGFARDNPVILRRLAGLLED
jgi:formate dehydrogenase maturation protein FdhE